MAAELQKFSLLYQIKLQQQLYSTKIISKFSLKMSVSTTEEKNTALFK